MTAPLPDDLRRLQTYDELVARIYADNRIPPDTRELALAMAWTQHRATEQHTPHDPAFWDRLRDLLGSDHYGRPRLTPLLASDAPRYKPPQGVQARSGICEGPRVRPYRPRRQADSNCVVYRTPGHVDLAREERMCGAHATIKVIEHDPITGWRRAHWFCRRHEDRAEEVRAKINTLGPPPEPIPNTGGLLPCYFAADWPAIYAEHRPGWQPPYYGVRADEWPRPEFDHVPRPPRLAIVTSSGR